MKNTISFPRLGISMNISPVAFSIGHKSIYWYAIIILAGFAAGLALVSINPEKRGIRRDNVWDIAIYGILAGIIGARIYYVLFAFDEFRGDFWGIFRVWEGGLAIYGGIIAAMISTSIYCKINHINLLNAFDVCCVGLLLGQSIGRWGNFTNCEVFGKATAMITGMSINGANPVHPLFFYESMWDLLGVILILLLRGYKTKNGQIFLSYLLWYSCGRLVLEGMRDTDYILYVIPGVLGISQLVAAILILLSVSGLVYVTRSRRGIFTPLKPINK